MKQHFYICQHCGNIVAMIRDCGVPIYCCGEEMHPIEPGITEASGEKHIPMYELDGRKVSVKIGSVEHPMNPAHYIEWICLETRHGVQYRVLTPEDKPVACFSLCDGDEVVGIYAFCNQHSLWKK